MSGPGSSGRRRLIARGITWNAGGQLVEAGLAFGAMLILVRIIPPAEYGRVGVVVGLLTLLNSFSFAAFAAQALQAPDGEEPDWTLHWTAGLHVQSALMLACHLLAGLCWLAPAYRPVAPLLHLAAFGLILDWPARLRAVMLRRALDFPRLKALALIATAAQLGVTIAVALAGGGAYAIVLGSNVVTALPLGGDLLLVRRWRPRPGWWRRPDWGAYRPALRFGLQQGGVGLLAGARSALEGLVLAWAVGYIAIGLLNRAQALLVGTIGRARSVLMDTAYPLLPRYAADAGRYAHLATLFVQALLLLVLPGALYVGLEGRALSRLLYGERWIAADPLIWPAALAGLGVGMFSAGSAVLLALSRLRACLALEAAAASLLLAPLAVPAAGGGILAYAWALAFGQLLAGGIALVSASPLLEARWTRSVLLPPGLASLGALAAVQALDGLVAGWPVGARLLASAGLYGLVFGGIIRGCFPASLATVLSLAPGGDRVRGWLRLSMAPAAARAAGE
jgi:PST family polysaccharide transporter